MNNREGLQLLSRDYTYSQIREITGIPESTISYVINGQRDLPSKYESDLTTASYFHAFKYLRDSGAGSNSAYIIAAESLSSIDDAAYQYTQIAEEYAKWWLASENRFEIDDETHQITFYGLESATTKWQNILNKYDVSLEELSSQDHDKYPPIEK